MTQLPQPPRLHQPTSLKPTTVAKLHRWEPRAHPHEQLQFAVQPYIPAVHGLDLLLHLWDAMPSRQERIEAFGPIGSSPTAFVSSYATTAEILIAHEWESDWRHGEGVLGLSWYDDILESTRARIHFYVFPPYRHSLLTKRVASVVLAYLFGTRGFDMLYGLTPVENRLALRFIHRIGFEPVGRLTNAVKDHGAPSDAIISQLTRDRWESLAPLTASVTDGSER